jgi:CubicO group peptidase (beta-lactamase class C family)
MPSIAVCIVKDDKMLWSKAYGYADLGPIKKRKATTDMIYPIASTSKSVCAVAIMQLYEKGLIDLNDDVSKYLPFDLKNPRYPEVNITFRMLMAHQSSVGDTHMRFTMLFTFLKMPYTLLDDYFLPGGTLYSPKVWNNYAPGKGVVYSTQNNEILSYALEHITGQSYTEYCQENIFKPLKMYNTSFFFSDYPRDKLARLYVWVKKMYFNMPYIEPTHYAGGGIKSSISDFSHFLIMHTNGGIYDGVRILNETSIEQMHSIQYPGYFDSEIYNHGFGWYQHTKTDGETYGGHGGRHNGAGSEMVIRYSDKTGILLFWNQFSFINSYILSKRPPEEIEGQREIINELFNKADFL